EIESELAQAEEAIVSVTGKRPVGFRGPGFIFSQEILRVLLRRGYEYDASTFPTYLGPLARAYYFMTTKLEEEEKRKRKALFGKLRDGLQPLKPYRWQVESGTLVEIPVTTMPVFKVPVHVSYVLYLSRYSRRLALSYFKTALKLCRMTGTELSLLLHPLDFLGGDDVEDLAFFPGMNIAGQEKLALVGELIDELTKHFNVLTLREHAQKAAAAPDLPMVAPSLNAREQQV
ncbi:MAG: polysaccharide deacetylase, partial [Acidobacteria bacterium]|nr:polysaccharide deacetylase [Acidobacteriota bacterium]